MKNWLLILCIAMGLLMIIGLSFIGVGLQRENTPEKQMQREMQESGEPEKALAFDTLFAGEAAHV